MIKVRPAGERGKTRTSWLDSSHTFSFNRYYDPRYTGFRSLLIINEDLVTPGQGFGPRLEGERRRGDNALRSVLRFEKA